MRICIVTQYFWPESFRINDLVCALRERGHEIQVLTGQPNYPSGVIEPEYRRLRPTWSQALDSQVLRVPIVPRGSGSGLRLAANYASFAMSASVFGTRRMRMPIDVVMAYEPSPVTVAMPALALARRARAAATMWVQDIWPDTLFATARMSGGLRGRAVSLLTKRLHRSMDRLLVQSRGFTPPLIAQGVAEEKIVYLPNWAEEEFAPVDVPSLAPERKELPSGFVVMFAGNLGVAQGLEVMVEAADLLRATPDIQFVVLGDGRQADWLRGEVKRRKLSNLHMLGQRPQQSMPTWFALADALLVTLRPGSVYELTVPSKIQAYLACGRPIVASIGGEAARIVEESGAGFATRAGDAAALAESIRRLYGMTPTQRDTLGQRGRDYSRANFDRNVLLDRIEAVLSSAVQSRITSSTPA